MYSVVIAAAGMGSRMNLGYNKLLVEQEGQTLIEKTVNVFLKDASFKQIILVCSESDLPLMKRLFHENVDYVLGGQTRQESVYQGLKAVTQEYVFIHDGARPFIDQTLLEHLKEKVTHWHAVLPVVDVKDTIKVVVDGIVKSTPARDTLKQAQTPQVFLTSAIIKAHAVAVDQHFVGTDDAQLYEMFMGNVYVIEGSYQNIKITTPEDLKQSR